MPARKKTSVAAAVLQELQSNATLREQFARLLGSDLASKQDGAEQMRVLEQHARVLEDLVDGVKEQGK